MRAIACALALILFFAVPVLADFTLSVDGMTYEGVYENGRVIYKMDGAIIGYLKADQERAVFTDENGHPLGSAVSTDKGWDYYDRDGKPLGCVEVTSNIQGLHAVYRDWQGNIIGYAQGEGCFRLNFLDASNTVIGAEIGSNALPLRPIPLEIWLRTRR